MTLPTDHNTKLLLVIDLIEKGSTQEAATEFREYLSRVKSAGPYSTSSWPTEWRKNIYRFGELFTTRDAGPFLEVIRSLKEGTQVHAEREVLDFFYSEIIWTFFDEHSNFAGIEFKALIRQYPANPEFHHSFSHHLERNSNFDQAVGEADVALKVEPLNPVFSTTRFNKGKTFFDHLLSKKRLVEAEQVLKKMWPIFQNDTYFHNMLVNLKGRLDDHRIIDGKISGINDLVENAIQKERGRILEIIGVFVAILGFVFINVNLALANLSYTQFGLLMLAMALILSIFAISISYLSRKGGDDDKFLSFLKHRRFWVLVVLATALFFTLTFGEDLVKFFHRLVLG